jgi:hypothetical protein
MWSRGSGAGMISERAEPRRRSPERRRRSSSAMRAAERMRSRPWPSGERWSLTGDLTCRWGPVLGFWQSPPRWGHGKGERSRASARGRAGWWGVGLLGLSFFAIWRTMRRTWARRRRDRGGPAPCGNGTRARRLLPFQNVSRRGPPPGAPRAAPRRCADAGRRSTAHSSRIRPGPDVQRIRCGPLVAGLLFRSCVVNVQRDGFLRVTRTTSESSSP